MPIIYLVILGKSMGGDLRDLRIAIVAQDHGDAAVRVRDRIETLAQSRGLFRIRNEPDVQTAVDALRQGRYKAAVIVPTQFSEDFVRGEAAPLGLVVDNPDATSAGVVEAELRRAFADVKPPVSAAGSNVQLGIQVERVDVYGHKEFMQYLVPGVIALALFF